MDRNFIIGIALIFVILVTFAYLNQPSEQEIKTLKHSQDSIALLKRRDDSIASLGAIRQMQQDSVANRDTAAQASSFGTFASYANGEERFENIENDDLKVTFSNKGGRIYRVE